MGQLGADIGGGGGNNHQIGAVGQGNVLHLMDKVPVKGIHHCLPAGELLKRQGGDKLGGVFGHYHFHIGMKLYQSGSKAGCLVGSDTAGDTQKDGFFF